MYELAMTIAPDEQEIGTRGEGVKQAGKLPH
jgi:hypothetical protein